MLPLDDLLVIDLTVARAGPTAVRQLADWGARVIRVEPPPGDAYDELAGARHGSDFQNLHRNKRAITIDLKAEDGRALLHDLVRRADVVVENWRPPVKARLGVDYETLRAVNPRLVYGSISGFGQDGPYAGRGGVDQIAQGLGGLMSITGLEGQGPVRVGIPVADLSAGLYLAIGIFVALHERERTGQGRWVRTSLLEAMVAMLDFQAARWTIDAEVPPQAGNHHPTGIPMGCFATSDGYVNIAGSNGRLWRGFCEALGEPGWVTDERFRTAKLRSQNREVLNELIAERLAGRTTAEWVALLTEHAVPVGPVNDIAQTFADEQVQHLGLVAEVDHAVLGRLGLVRHAVTFADGPPTVRAASPELGEHTDAVLAQLGIDPARIADLRARGVL
ncbi:MAG: CaiB/BaiF CoA transferase family protein [Acidimicrobiia bacterium]